MTDPGQHYLGEPLFDGYDGDGEPPDPDELLNTIRDLMRRHAIYGRLTPEETAELVAAVDLLDDLLIAGCPLPYPWRLATCPASEAQAPARHEEVIIPSEGYLLAAFPSGARNAAASLGVRSKGGCGLRGVGFSW